MTTSPWEALWDRLNDRFAAIALMLRECNPRLWWSAGHHATEHFPFSAWASFNRTGTAGEEDLVISVTAKLMEGSLVLASDISRGDGLVLADGPERRIRLATDTGTVAAAIADAGRDLDVFLEDHAGLLREELCSNA